MHTAPVQNRPERVLILGATSAVAAEVAVLHAERGDRIHLVGRNPQKLAAVVARCNEARARSTLPRADEGRVVSSGRADFDKLASNEAMVRGAEETLGEIDVVLIAHGLLGDQLATERSFDEAEKIFRTNLLSVVSLLVPIANRMESRGVGRIGVITSVAGDRGRPRNYTYGAAKGALNVYLQGLRTRLYGTGVSVTTLKLGPVDSPMTTDHEKNALFSRPDVVARDIVRAMDRCDAEVYVPAIWSVIMPVVRSTPEFLFQKVKALSGR